MAGWVSNLGGGLVIRTRASFLGASATSTAAAADWMSPGRLGAPERHAPVGNPGGRDGELSSVCRPKRRVGSSGAGTQTRRSGFERTTTQNALPARAASRGEAGFVSGGGLLHMLDRRGLNPVHCARSLLFEARR